MKYAKQILSLLAVTASLLLLAACGQKSNCNGISFGTGGSGSGGGGLNSGGSVCGPGSGGGNGSAKDFLFFQQQGNLLNTAIFDGATLKANMSSSAASLGTGAGADMVVVNKKFVYLTWMPQSGVGQVLGFSINRTGGTLTPVGGSPFDAGTSAPDSIVADPDGRYLVVGNSANGDLSSFAIDQTTGGLTLSPNSPLANSGMLPTHLATDGTGKFLYATESTGGDVFGFVIDQTTFDLTAMPSLAFFNLTRVAGEPTGQYLLGVDGGSLAVVTLDQNTGALLSKVDFPTAAVAESVMVHPSGKFVYASSVDNPLEGFAFSGGALTALAGSPFTSLPILRPLKIDQNGTALFGFKKDVGLTVQTIDPATGAVSGGIPDLAILTTPNFAPTN
jgi:DNA-binding beta-propeller fold protein YncE